MLLKRIEDAFNNAIGDEMKKTEETGTEGEKSRQFWKSIFSKQ